jgi:predicted phage tail protein
VRAINEHGPGAWSVWSNAVIPYGTPGTPSNVALAYGDQWTGTSDSGELSGSWAGVNANGGTVTFHWQLLRGGSAVSGKSGTTTGTTTGAISGLGAGAYTLSVYAVNSGGKQGAAGASAAKNITAQGSPARPSVSATVNSQYAPNGKITWSWGAVTASPGGSANISYRVSTNGGANWTNVGNDLSYSRSSLGAGSHSLVVQAVNKSGAGQASAASSATIQPQPRNPGVTLAGVSSTTYTCSNGNYACKKVAVRFTDTSGTYNVVIQVDGGGTSNSTSMPGSGTHLTQSYQASTGGKSVRVVASGGPDGTLYSPWISSGDWDYMRNNGPFY